MANPYIHGLGTEFLYSTNKTVPMIIPGNGPESKIILSCFCEMLLLVPFAAPPNKGIKNEGQ